MTKSDLPSKFSGIVVNQNQKPGATDFLAISDGAWRYQEVFLPANYQRGTGGEGRYPSLSGAQFLVGITDIAATIEWKLQYQVFGLGWLDLASGISATPAIIADKVWFDILFNNPVPIDSTKVTARFRLGFRQATPGISKLWYSAPNPFVSLGNARLQAADGVTAITRPSDGAQMSALFRLLALVADDGVDFLGNRYRSVVVEATADNANTVDGDRDKYFLSAPQPSRFAIVNLYFDETQNSEASVIDRVMVDPITPGVYFNVYYSSEGNPGTTTAEWDNKLWVHVPATFRAEKREIHALPEPIIAKYVKIEFCHLQARHYSPGDFAKPITYQKHPKWVLDYFLARLESQRTDQNRFAPNSVGVIYDALDLAYNYYLDDLGQEPDQPLTANVNDISVVGTFLKDTSYADRVDPTILSKINLVMQPYSRHPSNFATRDSLLGQYVQDTTPTEYPTEAPTTALTDHSDLTVLRNEAVVFESDYPVMFFYLTSRHAYREVTAEFSHDRAYFAGVREISFSRERYTTAYDNKLYIEPGGDLLNTALNDFTMSDGRFVV